jgi:hypothetical protein
LAKSKKIVKEKPLKLNMTFEEAMKKALNTELPTKKAKKKGL